MSVRSWLTAVAVLLTATACASPKPVVTQPSAAPPAAPVLFSAAGVHAAMIDASAFGPQWKNDDAPTPKRLPYLCAGLVLGPTVPATADTEARGAWIRGEQTWVAQQYALAFDSEAEAVKARGDFQAAAAACAPRIEVPRKPAPDHKTYEPAYTESVQVKDYTEGDWSGFVVTRPKRYTEKAQQDQGATRVVAVLGYRNAIIVLDYSYYGAAKTPPGYDKGWHQALTLILGRVA